MAFFGCQIWGVNFLDLKKGVDNNELERAEASSPAYHTHWVPLIFILWNTLKSNTKAMAHDIWKNNIKLMLNGCHDCWSYKAIKFAFDIKLTNFDPDNNILSTQTFNEVCSISFNEEYTLEYINTLYEKKVY